MAHTLIGYARCSTDKQDLAAQKEVLLELGVAPNRIYTDRGFTATNRARPGLDQALAAVRSGDTFVVPKREARVATLTPEMRPAPRCSPRESSEVARAFPGRISSTPIHLSLWPIAFRVGQLTERAVVVGVWPAGRADAIDHQPVAVHDDHGEGGVLVGPASGADERDIRRPSQWRARRTLEHATP